MFLEFRVLSASAIAVELKWFINVKRWLIAIWRGTTLWIAAWFAMPHYLNMHAISILLYRSLCTANMGQASGHLKPTEGTHWTILRLLSRSETCLQWRSHRGAWAVVYPLHNRCSVFVEWGNCGSWPPPLKGEEPNINDKFHNLHGNRLLPL